MTAFPGAAHDDFVDAIVQALTFLRQPPEPGIIDYYRNLAIAASTGAVDAFDQGQDLIDAYENARIQIETGYCRKCGASLLQSARLAMDLANSASPVPPLKAFASFPDRLEYKN